MSRKRTAGEASAGYILDFLLPRRRPAGIELVRNRNDFVHDGFHDALRVEFTPRYTTQHVATLRASFVQGRGLFLMICIRGPFWGQLGGSFLGFEYDRQTDEHVFQTYEFALFLQYVNTIVKTLAGSSETAQDDDDVVNQLLPDMSRFGLLDRVADEERARALRPRLVPVNLPTSYMASHFPPSGARASPYEEDGLYD
jgi:hypothetical protein